MITAVATWFAVRKQLKKSQKLSSQTASNLKKEKALNKTVLMMTVGFTVTTGRYKLLDLFFFYFLILFMKNLYKPILSYN